jgi:hypothetical protein
MILLTGDGMLLGSLLACGGESGDCVFVDAGKPAVRRIHKVSGLLDDDRTLKAGYLPACMRETG